jgi:hypothetical protein
MLSGLIALGIFFSLPKVVAIVQEAVKAPQFKYGNAWAESIWDPRKQADPAVKGRIQDWYRDTSGGSGLAGRLEGLQNAGGVKGAAGGIIKGLGRVAGFIK